MKNKIFNIPFSNSFVDVIANKFLAEYKDNLLELSDVLFLLPNRRACKALQEAFLREQGLAPTMLPKILPIGDVEEDELFLTGFNSAKILDELSPAISKLERMLLFAKLVMAKPIEYGIGKLSSSQACFLARELANLIDLANNEGLSFDKLSSLVPEEYSLHWQETLKLLEIITEYWPKQLRELGLVDPSQRQNQLLLAQSKIWQQNPLKHRVVVAGTTATYPAMKELVKTILGFENSEVVLFGLDKYLDEADWEAIDETHPQFELKDLLSFLEISRFEVKDYVQSQNKEREVFISEVMRPAKTTDKWRDVGRWTLGMQALNGLQTISCADIREEALSIALIMREVLESPEKTAALVTSDRNLARRVSVELERWNLKVDDSAGKPLHLTPAGQFLRLIVRVIEDDFSDVSFLSLLKHPFLANGNDYAFVRQKTRDFEKKVLRARKSDEELQGFAESVKTCMAELRDLLAEKAEFKEILECHIKTAEALASTDKNSGANVLWKGDAGEAAANFVSDLYQDSGVLGEIDAKDYLGIVEALMSSVSVRPKYGMHPRLKILGPIEARLQQFDTVIVGEVNEGVWPKTINADPWMSRPMKKEFGFPLPEKATGIMAHDFCSLLAGKEVYLLRADRVQGTPMVKSRWQMRLETVLAALGHDVESLENSAYRSWARYMDRVEVFRRILPPEPKPPVEARPRELYASAVENLMRDPYIIFARYILNLKPLDDLDVELNFADYGNIVHAVLDEFNRKYPTSYPEDAYEKLISLGEKHFSDNKIGVEIKAFWWPSFVKTAEWLSGVESKYRQDIAKVYSEVRGSLKFEAPAGEFAISAKADRVDVTASGKINIIDYKTGQARKPKEVKVGYAPQLPIEGLIAKHGGFENVPKADVEKLIYWRLGREEVSIGEDVEEILERNFENIKELVSLFDKPETAYKCRPNPKHAPKYSDYEHLARVAEWSVEGGDDVD